MKGILNYIWKNRLLPRNGLHTVDGTSIEVVSYGYEGGDEYLFRDTMIRIGNEVQCGNVVLSRGINAEDEGIILHVTTEECTENSRSSTHTSVPHICIELPRGLEAEFARAEQQQESLPCDGTIGYMNSIDISGFLSRLAVERIEEKGNDIIHTFAECRNLWDDALFKTIARSFGFGIQSTVFGNWARTLDMNALGKHRDNLLQVEAIMFGQAGLLDESSIPHYYLKEALESRYYKDISREYRFLKNKFGLKEIDHREWSCGSTTPHVRLARLAALYSTKRIGISAIQACDTVDRYRNIIDTVPGGYWYNHTNFGSTETTGNCSMKQHQLDVVIINAVIPTLYIYGKHRNDSAVCNKAEDLLCHIKGEENSIVKKWKGKGITIECAADSQAVIQLEKKYCRTHNCTKCRIAYHYIKEQLK